MDRATSDGRRRDAARGPPPDRSARAMAQNMETTSKRIRDG
jgi:hypothetical protein